MREDLLGVLETGGWGEKPLTKITPRNPRTVSGVKTALGNRDPLKVPLFDAFDVSAHSPYRDLAAGHPICLITSLR